MLHINRLLTTLLLVALILGACQPVQLAQPEAAPATTAPVPYTPREDAPTYGMRGPYAVGVRDFVIEGKDGARPISVSVWYPGLNPDGAAEAVEYMLDYDNPAFPDFAVAGRALRDAEPDISAGPYPLVVHSHGLWQFRQANAWLMEHLASHGFVVMAGDHDDNWGDIMGEPAGDNYVVRPQEITRVINFAETLGADGEFAGMIDLEHVGVTGHSYGAETALLAGGARLDTDHLLNEWCALNPGDPEDPLNDCVTIPPLLDKMAEMAGLDEVPVGPWPDWSDPRVDAVVPLLAGAHYFGPEGLAALHEPVLLVESELDLFYGQSNAYYHPYTLLPASNKTHVYYDLGDHMLFANNCEAMPGLVEQGLGWFCWDSVWDTGRAKDLASHFVTAFLLAELKGDAEAATALAAENVSFPGIQYETTAFGATVDALIQPEQGFAEVNGTRLYYEMAGAGDPIVMIHGLGWDTRGWDTQFAEFASQYSVVRYDMRGFGKSDMPTDQPYAHADDLKALMEYLGINVAHVFGHSFGGEIAINFALAYPEATRSLVLIEPDIQGAQGLPAITPEEEASFAAAFVALEKGDRVGAALAIVDLHPVVAVAKDVPRVREFILGAFTDYEWFQFLNEDPVVQPAIPSAERIEEITAPTLLVVGDSTTEFQKIEVERLAEQMPNAQTVLFENSDHFPHLLYPEKFNSVVFDFLANAGTTAPTPEPAAFVALSEVEFTSEALVDNLLGDPATRKFAIYLPPSYATGEGRYPVVYALHGFTGNQWGMLGFQELMNAMIKNGDIPEMIVVMPDASNVFKGSFYMNSPTIGDYATYITSDVVEWVDTHYRTIPQQEARGITGCSMGGLGAVRLGLQFPQVFGVVAGVSGPYLQAYHRMLDRASAQITSVPETFEEMAAQPFEVQAIFALAAAAAPNADNPPFYLDVPFANVDGAVQPVQDVIERFSVVYAGAAVEGYQERATQLQEILLYHGDQDPMAGVEGARLFSAMLAEKGVAHEYLEKAGGGHCNLDYEPVIRFMAEHLFFASEATPHSGLDEATVSKIEALVVEMMARNKLPGFALGVVKDGALVYAKGFGVTSLDGGEAVTPQTLFQWAETSMSLTALAVMQLVEQGKIDLDAPVTEYLPYFQMKDEGYKQITVAQLLAHKSGIPDSGDAMADWESFMPEYDPGAVERWVRADLAEMGLLFAPGTGWEYSDLGYALLGPVIAAASGQTYEDYMSEKIFAPLGMDKSSFLLEEVDKTLLATPHAPGATGEGMVSAALPYHRPFAATNNLFTSVEEMAKLTQAYLNRGANNQHILPESVFEQMWQPQSPTPYADFPFGRVHPSPMMIDWGYGWFLGDIDGHMTPNAFGREHGFHAGTVLAPDADLAVIAVGNGAVIHEYYANDIATDVMAMLLEDIKPK